MKHKCRYPNEKTTCTVVSTSTGWPFNIVGLYFHSLTAVIADAISSAGPETYSTFSIEPSFEMIACSVTVPDTCAVLAIFGYAGVTCFSSDAACTSPPTLIRAGAAAGGGGGGPPAVPTPPNTSPVPPATPAVSDGATDGGASSFATSICFGITVGASIWFTANVFCGACFTTACCGGGGGAGGGGATRNVFITPVGSVCVYMSGISKSAPRIPASRIMETPTDHGVCVRAISPVCPETTSSSNMATLLSKNRAVGSQLAWVNAMRVPNRGGLNA